MARYDRIARIPPPARAEAFPGWSVLRDLEGRERETDLGRRARVRFLVLRPFYRVLAGGLSGPGAESLAMQIDVARSAIDQLPARDPERARLDRCVAEAAGRSARGMTLSAVEAGEGAELDGHGHAAEEFLRTALDLATAHQIPAGQARALSGLGRIHRRRGETERARECLEAAVAAAGSDGDLAAAAGATLELARMRLDQGDTRGARPLVTDVMARGIAAGDDAVTAAAAAGLCALELAEGRLEEAMEAGWRAIELLPPGAEARNPVLVDLGSGFRRMGLRSAAESCYRMVVRLSGSPELRAAAAVDHALTAAEAGDADEFRTRRDFIIGSPAPGSAPPALRAATELGLGRGALLVGDSDDARMHLRTAIGLADAAGLDATIDHAEELLSGLERAAGMVRGDFADTTGDPPVGVRRIAERIESLGRELVPSG